MPVNDYLPFATSPGATVLSQPNYAGLTARGTGFQQGIADEYSFNKAMRQASMAAAVLAQFTVDNSGQDLFDDGNIASWEAKLARAIANSSNTVLFGAGGYRTRLAAPLNIYVATTGNDSNTGLTPSTPLATLQAAWNLLVKNYDLNYFNATINVAAGTYTQGVLCVGCPPGLSSTNQISGNPVNCITFLGNISAPQTVVVNVTNNNCFVAQGAAEIVVSGMQLQASGVSAGNYQNAGAGLYAIDHASILFGNIIFNACTTGMTAGNFGMISSGGSPYTINGSGQSHILSSSFGVVIIAGSTVTVSNTPAFSNAFIFLPEFGFLNANQTIFNGPATGVRFVLFNGMVTTAGGGPNFFPGNSPGVNNAWTPYT